MALQASMASAPHSSSCSHSSSHYRRPLPHLSAALRPSRSPPISARHLVPLRSSSRRLRRIPSAELPKVMISGDSAFRKGMQCEICVSKNPNPLLKSSCILSRRLCFRRTQFACSLSFPSPENFQPLLSAMGIVKTSLENLQTIFPREMKEASPKTPEDKVKKYFILLGKEMLRWPLVAFLTLSPIWDVFAAISRSMELMIPVGLFVGILAAEFSKVISEELLRTSNEEWDTRMHLLGIGLVFAFIKLGLVFLRPPGQILFSHICNGGLVQVLWLVKNLGETSNEGTEGNEASVSMKEEP